MLEAIILPLVLAFLMFGLGMSLELSDFNLALKRWRMVLGALASIYLATTAFAWLIGRNVGLEAPLAAGLLLLATCPGGMFSNMVTHSAGGNVALSVTLTVCSSLLYAVAMPLCVFAWMSTTTSPLMSVAIFRTIGEILCVVVLPLAAGMVTRRKRVRWSLKYEARVRNASSLLIAGVFVALALQQFELFKRAGLATIAAVLLLNLAGWAMAGLIVFVFRLSKKELIALGAEHSIRQEGLGVFVAATLLSNTSMVPPLLINSLIGLLISVICVSLINLRSRAGIQGARALAVQVNRETRNESV
jgi:BASS family bile acid:Na+ symporter